MSETNTVTEVPPENLSPSAVVGDTAPSAAAAATAEPAALAAADATAEPAALAAADATAEPAAEAPADATAEPAAETTTETAPEAAAAATAETFAEAVSATAETASPETVAEAAAEPTEDRPVAMSGEMQVLYEAMESQEPVEGQVIGWNKGGYHVALGRVAAFCPVSQIEIGNPRSPKRYLDKTFPFHVIEIQKGGRRVVLSRASALKAEQESRSAEVRARLKPGTIHAGKVSSITDFGAFVDLGGGIEGLVHVSEISRKRVEHPKETLKAGQEVRVTVLKIEKGGRRISLSMKRLEDDPWNDLSERLIPGEKHEGVILRKTDFGLFVEVEPGIEGLVHTSRLPLGAALEDESLEAGSKVEVWIHEIEAKRRRLSLSLRPVAASKPWKGIEKRFIEGNIVQGRVERLAKFGVFIELEPGVTGLLPFSELSMPTGANPRRQFHPGKEVSVRVLAVDPERRRISLGTESSKAMGSHVDYREYQKQHKAKSDTGLNAMAAAFEKLREKAGA